MRVFESKKSTGEKVASRSRLARLLAVLAGLVLLVVPASAAQRRGHRFPNILLISIDTLRADHLSGYGDPRPTTPHIDRLLAQGARFAEARTVEPLTSPSLCSMLTSRFPHEHGSTRNGLRMRPGLESLPKLLAHRGYRTAAFVGNWTLRDKLTGLGEHFQEYHEVFSRKRWLGLFDSEATGEDLTAAAGDWIEDYLADGPTRPYFVWVHYVEPHAPYRFQEDFAERLGIPEGGSASKADRYDTEIAFDDREVGRLLSRLSGSPHRLPADTLILFLADHGESLGGHAYWGHGRHLFESGLHVPLGFVWPGRIPPGTVEQPALLLDVAPTVVGLLGLPAPTSFRGFDWSPVFHGAPAPARRTMFFQAHKGAVQIAHKSSDARLNGLLEVARIAGDHKEVLDLRDGRVHVYDLARDPRERRDLAAGAQEPSEELATWLDTVRQGLRAASDIPPTTLDAESEEHLRALGYIN